MEMERDMETEEGFYWVQYADGWEVAEWDGATWWRVGAEDAFFSEDFQQIDDHRMDRSPMAVSALTLLSAAIEVMGLLEKHGPSIGPHLLDTDMNAGQRLRDAIAAAQARK